MRALTLGLLVCGSLLVFSAVQAADREGPRGRATSQQVDRSDGPVTLHRLLRDHVESKLVRLLVHNTVPGAYDLLGLSDDPDPTGLTAGRRDDRGDDDGAGRAPMVDRLHRSNASSEEARRQHVAFE